MYFTSKNNFKVRSEYRDSLLLRHTLFVLGGKKVGTLHHGNGLHGILLDEIFFREVAEKLVEEDVDFLHSRVEGAAMSSPMLRTGRRKIGRAFGGFTPALGEKFYTDLFFVTSTAAFEAAPARYGRRKKD